MRRLGTLIQQLFILAALALAVLSGCKTGRPTPKTVNDNYMGLADWLKRIDAGELSDWDGWSSNWKLADVQAMLPIAAEPQGYKLGTRTLDLFAFTLERQSQPLHVLADKSGQVVLVPLEDAVLDRSAEELAKIWGRPNATKNLPSDHRYAPAELWAWPSRGISLYVMDPKRHQAMSLSSISLYPSTDLKTFLAELDADERVRMWED